MKRFAAVLVVSLLAAGAQRAAAQGGVPADVEKQLEQAQERLNQTAREVADLSLKLYGTGSAEMPPMPPMPGRGHPVLGINIGSGSEAGAEGVKILSVSPGGPADKAGLRANDVIMTFEGRPLKTEGRQSPRQQLLRELRETRPDTAVTLEYRRDGRNTQVAVTPKNMVGFMEEPYLDGLKTLDADGGNLNLFFGPHASRGFGSAEFLTLTPGLGRYFGTDRGLLVVRAPQDERLKLEEGDVVLDIDGRVPSNASHAFRIFSSYRGGETLKLHVVRQQKKLELPVQVPADGAKLGASEPPDGDGFVVASPGHGAADD